jgi:hypothetical protein
MMLLIFNDNIIARMRSIMEKISFPIIIIEVNNILYLVIINCLINILRD